MQQPYEEARRGNMDVSLYERYAPGILAYLCQHITNRQDAEDLLVEVFLAALKQPNFASLAPDHQAAWLKRVASNKMIDRLRQMSRLKLAPLDAALEQESAELTPEEQSLRQERYALLYRCLARLNADQQELLRLRYGEGLRLVDIAARLRKPDGTVRKQLLRALQRLRTLYDQFMLTGGK